MCKHKWMHYDMICSKTAGRYGSTFYIRTDFFHCEKCLETKEIRKEKELLNEKKCPEWWKNEN